VQHAPEVAQKPAPIVAKPPAPKPAPAAPKPAPAAAPAAGPSGWDIVATASKYLGFPYVWGAVGPKAFDCSGFVWYVYRKVGNPIPRDMWGQYQSGTHITRANLQPGDIVFFAGTYGSGLSHNGIYIGGGRFIAAADYGIGVTVSSFTSYYLAHYYGAVRPW
jgi:cell wall-associated NlpC family hydrolase